MHRGNTSTSWLPALLFAWMAMLFCAGGDLFAAGAVPEAVTKVVHQYALTSANDFPQRDPQDWRLLGSNDKGSNWITLDVRKGEVFSERHQRRVFQITNDTGFNVYRLQIDRVREPASANSVHLAEIEPLGRTEDDFDPAPCLEDVITVQGDNPPFESRFLAFDGQAETKWLDFAAQNAATRASWIQWQYVMQPSLVITNIKQLLGLRARASTGYPVRIDGVLVNHLPETNILCFLDATGYLEIPGVDDARYSPGQRLLLQGTSQWGGRQAEIVQCHITPLGQSVPSEPKPIALDQPLGSEEEMQWVEAEGTVQFCTGLENHAAFELTDQDRSLCVQVLHLEREAVLPKPGQRARVRGLLSGSLDVSGRRVAGTLFAPGTDAILLAADKVSMTQPADSARVKSKDADSSMLDSIWQVRQLSPEQLGLKPKVVVRAVITDVFGSYAQDDTAGIELWVDHSPAQGPAPPSLGTYVQLTGSGDWIAGHGPVIRVEKIVPVGKGKLPNPKRPSWKELVSGKVFDQWIEMEGVVRSTDGSHLLLICEGGQMMATIRSASVPVVNGLVDATVRLRGLNISATDDRGRVQGIQLVVPSLEYVQVERPAENPFSLPVRPLETLSQISGPAETTHRVKVAGVLTLRRGRTLFLQDASGSAMAIGRADVVLDSLPGAYRWAFFQAADNTQSEAEAFVPGDNLEVVGFSENREGHSAVLTEALVRKVGLATLAAPVKATINDIAMGKLDSTLVSLDALVLGQEKLGEDLVFELQSGQKLFQAIMPATNSARLPVAVGSRVSVVGVCQNESSPFPELGKRIASFKLLIGSPAGMTIVERPAWWTITRALTMAVALAVILAVAAGWIRILRRQVEARTSQLKSEVEQHQRTEEKLARNTARLRDEIEERKIIYGELNEKKALLEKEIEERKRIEAEVEEGHKKLLRSSRLAGMAEVSTNVLHNVGNVLNSANMLASLISEHTRGSKAPTLVKTAELFAEHRHELGAYLTQDERGRHVPALLGQLAAHFAEEQNRVQAKVDALIESIQHIREIVTMQQNYARVSTPTETVCVTDVVEDALRLSGGAFGRKGILIAREFENVPAITVDRHKLLQILFNLLENARHACIEDGRPNRQVTIQVRAEKAGHAQISVSDNGAGIPAENLPRIFSQGFFTRKNGHGFGLHSSILAAQDMGGSLTARSEGQGKGAVFILEFPDSPPPA